ncbi:MAG: hypothetical protein HQL67_08755 [Magnetococcales bacterium]|nr:hypothetical protein [Magnetococcales bacterium]
MDHTPFIPKSRRLLWCLLVFLPFCHPDLVVTVRASSAESEPTAILDQIRYVKQDSCGKGAIWIEEIFSVSGFDPADLLLVRKDRSQSVFQHPVSQTDSAGRIVHAYCASRFYTDFIESHFLSHTGQSTSVARYSVWAQGQPLEAEKSPTLSLHQITGYDQFSDEKNPKKGICCWHYAYVNYAWQSPRPVTTIQLPLVIRRQPAADSHLYLMYYSAVNGIKFYLGYQTNLKNSGVDQGPGVIFSRWDSQDPADLHTVESGFFEIGAYEGRFVSVRKPLVISDSAVFELRAQPDSGKKSGVWLELTVVQDREGVKKREKIGSLRFPASEAVLSKKLKMTIESYSLGKEGRANVWRVPDFDFYFPTPQIDGHSIEAVPHIVYPKKVPRIVQATAEKNGVDLRRIGLICPLCSEGK